MKDFCISLFLHSADKKDDESRFGGHNEVVCKWSSDKLILKARHKYLQPWLKHLLDLVWVAWVF
jgi:hypothetical protein